MENKRVFSHMEKYYYLSIPMSNHLTGIKILHKFYDITIDNSKSLSGMFVFGEKESDYVLQVISNLIEYIISEFIKEFNNPPYPDPNKKYYYIHTPTACRVLEMKVSENPEWHAYPYNYFETKEKAEHFLAKIWEFMRLCGINLK